MCWVDVGALSVWVRGVLALARRDARQEKNGEMKEEKRKTDRTESDVFLNGV